MIPYATFEYFLFLLYPLSLLVVLGLLGRLGLRTILIVSLGAVLFQYANPLATEAGQAAGQRQLAFLAAYVGASVAVVLAFGWFRRRYRSQPVFVLAIALALLPLVASRVYPLAHTAGWLGPAAPPAEGSGPNTGSAGLIDTFGFLGLSYMTFRVVDAIIVLQDGLVKWVGIGDLATYLLFAPTISAGPIDRYRRFVDDLRYLPRPTKAYLYDLEAGIHRIAQGFLYKFIIAVLISRYALDPATRVPGLPGLLAYMYAYSFFLFFDFAGYSAFAIGVGRFFGIRVPENFNAPFLSRDFREVWNRWHITLSWWMRDHVYMRFVLHAARRKWFGGNRHAASNVGLMLTMGLMGLWHGLAWHYVAYGIYQGSMLVAYDLIGRRLPREGFAASRVAHVASIVLTFNLFCFGLLIFSGHLFQ